MFKKIKNHSHLKQPIIETNDRIIESLQIENKPSIVNTNENITNNTTSIENCSIAPILPSVLETNCDQENLKQVNNENLTKSRFLNNTSEILNKEEISELNDHSYQEFEVLENINNVDDEKKNLLKNLEYSDNNFQNINTQCVDNDLNINNNYHGNNSRNNSRRSSITIDSCKTMNNEEENNNYTNDNNLNEKDKNNEIFENAIVISSTFENKNNTNINITNNDDEISLLKKYNKNKELFLDKHQNLSDLKLIKDDIFNNDSSIKDLYKIPINNQDNKDFDNVYTINTAIVNLNKSNIELPTSNVNANENNSNSNNSYNDNNNDSSNKNNDDEGNTEQIRSHSCSSISNILNNPNMKYMKASDILNNGHLKGYNQRHGSYANSSDNKNNVITKKAIINNALKNNNMGLLYTKRHNSMNNINKLKLNINLLQTTSPKAAKSAQSNKSLEDSPIYSPLTPNMKRMNGYKYNDILLTHRSNSNKKDGRSSSLENHRSINDGHNFNTSNSNASFNSNSSIGSNNKGSLNINDISNENIDFPSSDNINDIDLSSSMSCNDTNGDNNKSLDLDFINESPLFEDKMSSLKNWSFYKQFYRYIDLNNLSFKNRFIEDEYNKISNSLDDTFWKNDIPLECFFFLIINIILNLFNNNLQSTKIQLIAILIPVLMTFILFRIFHLNLHTKYKNFAIVLIFTLIGPINYLISFFSNNMNNSYLAILFTLNLIIWVFAGHFIMHTNYKYTRYSIIICYLLCLIPFYYKLFFIDTKSFINVNNTSSSLININNYTIFNHHNYSLSQYPFISFKDNKNPYYFYSSKKELLSFINLDNNNKVQSNKQYINALFDTLNSNSPSDTAQQNKIIIQEIQDLVSKGNSIYLYVDNNLIPLNPSIENDLSSSSTTTTTTTTSSSSSSSSIPITNNLKSSTNQNTEEEEEEEKENKYKKNTNIKNKKIQHLQSIINDYLSHSLTSIKSSYQELNDKINLSTYYSNSNSQLLDKKCYDKYELWVVLYNSPSQPLKLNNFIINYYYEKENEARCYLKQFIDNNKKQFIDKNSNNNNYNYNFNNNLHSYKKETIIDILIFIFKNFVSLECLVYGALMISCYIINKLKYELDLSLKLQYLTNCQYVQNNSILSLDSLHEEDLSRVADFSSPIEKAIDIINQLLNQTDKDSKNYELLTDALDHLNSSNLLLPDLERQLQGFVELEDEQKRWLLYEIAQQNSNYYNDDSDNSSENSPSSISSPFAYYELSSIDILSLIDDHTLQLLEKVKDYNFPIFEFCEATPRPLLTMSYHLFVKSGLIGRLHLSTEKFLNFIKEIEEGYHTDVTFHNACHVTDILHCMYYFTTIPNISVNFKDWDLLFMFVAACIHDYDHPGLSNKFLIQTMDPLAILYNDKSVLENHHCAMSFDILFKEKNNFMEHVDREKFNEFRE
eukprot:jgi/Orpsp1_1/1186593/evm.model.d7180000051757.1